LRNIRSVAGLLFGFSVVIAFAIAIYTANVFFSNALYIRDAREAAKRISWELGEYLDRGRAPRLTADLAHEGYARKPDLLETPPMLRSTLDGLDARRNASAATDMRIDRFVNHLESHEDVSTVAIVWFAGHDGEAADVLLPRASTDVLARAHAQLRTLVRDVRATAAPAVDVGKGVLGLGGGMSLIAIPIAQEGQLAGTVVVTYDQKNTGVFLTDILRFGVAIVVTLLFVAMGLAALFVWMRFRDRLNASKTIQFLAHHDALTSLPNRTVFNTKLTEALRLAHAKASNIAVILIDLDKFKDVNDTHGHAAGDLFLQIVSDRLSAVFSRHLVARLSGDEFAVLLATDADRESVTRLAEAMLAATEMPTRIDGKDIPVSVSMGIAQATDAAWRASRLLHCADLALYRAKHDGRSTYAWYTADMDADAKERKKLETDLRKALKEDQFRLLYQPQFSLGDLKLTGYESLLRWEHPERGTISPAIFIPIAEEAGLIEDIGFWVLRRACAEAAAWNDQSLSVSVNVSAAQFKPGNTERHVFEALQASGLNPRRLEIEITESLLIANTAAVVQTLTEVRALGVSVAMDDFGTGYSSLSYLSRFPFDTIKIDRSFVATLGSNGTTDAIIASIVGLGRSLGVTITAEGVENEEQVTLLRAAGCDKVQGFLFGRPMDLSNELESANAARQQEKNRAFLAKRRSSYGLPSPADAAITDGTAISLPEANASDQGSGETAASNGEATADADMTPKVDDGPVAGRTNGSRGESTYG
jgi:diguanylate cyclase (GGDEF)-like protein